MKRLENEIEYYNIHMSAQQHSQLQLYMDRFCEMNQSMNLSAIRSPGEIEDKHFLDSLIIGSYLQDRKKKRILDLGTGGGFPGVPIKILYPEAEVYFLDSVRKKLSFIRTACEEMGLKDVYFLHSRAEDAGRNPEYRASMDMVVARAVAFLPVLLEYAAPLLRQGGVLVAAKQISSEGLAAAAYAMGELSMRLVQQEVYKLPDSTEERQVLIFEKTAKTPKKYPRKAGIPKKTPLMR